eukprot:CAMPEP_0168770898 /NCGR_PEP_ID=MMETSP0725-20121227/3163_1 /TAXON_ID=265536 /ORGANISM="Amphiprora sp., Strain CCMP467" /LENGTH=227 /DNA_ID=CAMNT_0008820369 /DNA_START=15 /DNA_END=698 /DNA_ORIENTATION=-
MKVLSALIPAAALVSGCTAMPSIVLKSGETKCMLYEAAMDTKIKIDYKALDLDKEHPSNKSKISVHVRPSNRVIDTHHHDAPVRSHFRPTEKTLEETEGRIEHVFEVDGEASICFSSPRLKKPTGKEFFRFHYHVRIANGLDGDDEDDPKSGNSADINGHLGHMEVELQRIQRGMQSILREADFAKEREALFHKQTESMHSAAMFWPIVQVCVLLMTGFTQERRRII